MGVNGEISVRLVKIRLCDACLAGEGAECHTPGCALWLHSSPGHPIIRELYEILPESGGCKSWCGTDNCPSDEECWVTEWTASPLCYCTEACRDRVARLRQEQAALTKWKTRLTAKRTP